ncbi:4-hydroxyacetophenone monooxygenase [Microtetraspora sp. NBRC 13810]|uniref:flavin-containing monooxygenase n=1 Tax=Microtetraspora sp. NBRC 13810 TaxID=3030990 RepID=UPI0024A20FCD|nr:NAD(P)/FAD-dependent oxidoreductase [Microtetraspora sp. NBRC 13810]GLW07788.1 4-hydroxyacetophenone monooxygenase [Microtetraspora sp. NBRC 13810]
MLTVAIIGAGVGGLCMAIRLRMAGVTSFTVFEKAGDIGGTWRDNTYPGAGCDVPSHLYSYSFEKYASWTRRFPEQPEILAYLHRCADKYRIWPHIRLNAEVTSARYVDGRWRITTADGGEADFDVLVTGVGQLSRPRLPDIPGRADFAGTAFHSARWDHGHDLTGREVAVIGNGSSAAQFIPRIAPLVARLDVYQRTPNWVIPKPDEGFGPAARLAFHHLPFLQRAYRGLIHRRLETLFLPALRRDGWTADRLRAMALGHLARQVPDPVLRAKLTPGYRIGCKRIVVDNAFYPALTRPNVAVVTDPIRRITAKGVETADGTLRQADTIIYATGFHATSFLAPIEITGRDGRSLAERWRDGAEAYLGLAVPGFPNLFLLYGPNTNLGHNSIILMIEAQVRYILQCLRLISLRGPIEVRQAALAAWRRRLEQAMGDMIWQDGCQSWYQTESGRITTNWPGSTTLYRRLTRAPRPSAYTSLPRPRR